LVNYSNIEKVDAGNEKYIDLRSDTVTLPCEAMKQAMATATLGDDVYGEDPTVSSLETYVADLFEKESALFFPTGTQSNFAAVLAHCQRGEEVIVGRNYHIYSYEAQGASVLGGVALCPVDTDNHGALAVNDLKKSIKPDDFHFPISKLLCLENTVSGNVQAQDHIENLSNVAKENGLSVHMDGARIFNAQVHSKLPASQLVKSSDSVSVCLSKGLGAPAGSLLIGEQLLINKARRIRKMLGGGMRQAGVLAACGLYALHHNVERLVQDHARARQLARGLAEISELSVDYGENQTNMVFLNYPEEYGTSLQSHLRTKNILISSLDENTRLVCHLDISEDEIKQVIKAIKSFFNSLETQYFKPNLSEGI
jgi:threonine aldolase